MKDGQLEGKVTERELQFCWLTDPFKDMAPSVPNTTGSESPSGVPYGPYTSFPWEPLPEYSGEKSVMFRSADGKVVAAAAKKTGTATLTYPCDEFFFVTDGWVKLNVHGGDHFVLTKGEFVYLKKGTTVDFTFSPCFLNVAVFMDNEPNDPIQRGWDHLAGACSRPHLQRAPAQFSVA
ncbi:uncharacterized protein N7515_008226 [Penicillium bovifimosum]|uniref:(S)-ureidoglycine aminohydrolase cupin domain-containing protein n=1 Tax=Penicillium bovifimosum TaxID=126998 RepID=A0A9W9GMJ7_9EURO|nr:uncharacterized protein N7515_008226 [Penicillium bovifimosum]KAJ5124401.1 hypothetical protein N7515_008226 [Penicillium bovifimosum]